MMTIGAFTWVAKTTRNAPDAPGDQTPPGGGDRPAGGSLTPQDPDMTGMPVPVPMETWKYDTDTFLRAIRTHETPPGPQTNPWQITEGFLTDVYEINPGLENQADLTSIKFVGKLVRVYMTRYRARDDHHAAAIFRKGKKGCTRQVAITYADEVVRVIKQYQDAQQNPEQPVDLEKIESIKSAEKKQTKPPMCPMQKAIDDSRLVETEWD